MDREMRMADALNHANGMYTQAAISAAFSKSSKYPEQPLLADTRDEVPPQDIESALKHIAGRLGAKDGSNNRRRAESADHSTERSI